MDSSKQRLEVGRPLKIIQSHGKNPENYEDELTQAEQWE